MARALSGEAEIEAVSAYVESLPKAKPAPTLTGGDAATGAALFGTCIACHGPDGAGSVGMGGPALTGANDWYLLTQLRNFKSGVRGAQPGDLKGQLMVTTGLVALGDEKAMLDVLAHIQTLGN